MHFGATDERYNRLFPTPPEWPFLLRFHMRKTRVEETFYDTNKGIPEWGVLGMRYRFIVNGLEENIKSIDTKNMPMDVKIRLEKAGVPFDLFNFKGVDVSNKSVPWRDGYYTALMGAARAAEFLDGFVADVTRRQVFTREYVIGPSNPHPKPLPYGAIEAPLEENCADAFLSPKIFYGKIMETQGFNARQRMEASLAWANWLSTIGHSEEAEDKYDWALDIAMGDLPEGVDNVVDTRTGCINEGATHITEGIITATTALATFHAQQQNFSTALPIFASILRAYRTLPPPSDSRPNFPIPNRLDASQPESTWSLIWSTIVSVLSAPAYPDPPPSISTPLIGSPKQTCSEAAVMTNLGEIMFASSKSSTSSPQPSATSSILRAFSSSKTPPHPIATPVEASGLSWTSSAVDQAEATVDDLIDHPPRWKTREEVQESKEYCAECLMLAIENWKRMASILEDREFDEEVKAKQKAQARKETAEKSWGDWLRSSLFSSSVPDTLQEESKSDPETVDAEVNRVQASESGVAEAKDTILEQQKQKISSQGPWAQEARKVELRFLEIRKKIREEHLARKDPTQKGLWGWG